MLQEMGRVEYLICTHNLALIIVSSHISHSGFVSDPTLVIAPCVRSLQGKKVTRIVRVCNLRNRNESENHVVVLCYHYR